MKVTQKNVVQSNRQDLAVDQYAFKNVTGVKHLCSLMTDTYDIAKEAAARINTGNIIFAALCHFFS